MVGVAQDVRGEEAVRPVVEAAGVTFPVLLDHRSLLGRLLGFRVVPTGFFVDGRGIVRYRHNSDFDIADPRDRRNLELFLAGQAVTPIDDAEKMVPEALELFAEGVEAFGRGRREEALAAWRRAVELDPDNFVIRSQIWAVEHPENFYPVVDRSWQEQQLLREGYDKPLP
jgi:tetratricopeptide (TPR) repeat protein